MAAAAKEYSIYAKTLTGFNTEIRTSATETAGELKKKVQEKLKLDVPIARLVYNSKELSEDDKTVGDYEIGAEAIIIVVTAASKPSHFFFALDESGSMSGRRWQQLLESFSDFITARLEEAAKKGTPSKDRVTVCFHATHGRLATWRPASGPTVPFDNIPLADVQPDSLLNDFRSGGNNFDHALNFLSPYLRKAATDYTPVLLFMTDGGDCGDDDPRGGDFRQRAYDRMAALKAELPDLRLYVTVVFTNSPTDIEGAKKLCLAGGSDLETFFVHLEDEHGGLSGPYPAGAALSLGPTPYGPSPASYGPPGAYPAPPVAYGAPPGAYGAVASSFAAGPAPAYPPSAYGAPAPSPSASSAKAKMARQWEHAYQCNSSY